MQHLEPEALAVTPIRGFNSMRRSQCLSGLALVAAWKSFQALDWKIGVAVQGFLERWSFEIWGVGMAGLIAPKGLGLAFSEVGACRGSLSRC